MTFASSPTSNNSNTYCPLFCSIFMSVTFLFCFYNALFWPSECCTPSYCGCGMSQCRLWMSETGRKPLPNWNRLMNQHLGLYLMRLQLMWHWGSSIKHLRLVCCALIDSGVDLQLLSVLCSD